MSKYIDIEKVVHLIVKPPYYRDEVFATRRWLSENAIEVVRCKECKYHKGIHCYFQNVEQYTTLDDFCSHGVKR